MYKITDRQGFSYYMRETDIPEQIYDIGLSQDLTGVVRYVKINADCGGWICCYQDTRFRDLVYLRADEAYLIQEVKHDKG